MPVAQGKAGTLKDFSELLNVVGIESPVLERTIHYHGPLPVAVRTAVGPPSDAYAERYEFAFKYALNLA